MVGNENENTSINNKINTAELLIKCLENEGVKYIFGIPGEENLQIMNAINKSTIEFITTRHEQGAAFMADVYGRLTGKPGVCLSTLGPGATNLITGVADANLDGAPLVAITGQVGTDKLHLASHQYLDLVAMFNPVTKWSKQIVRPDTTPEIVRKAFKIASSEKPGATHINLPENIAAMDTDEILIKNNALDKSFASYSSIEKAAVAISRAKKPLVLAGNGAIRAGASKAIIDMAERLKIPVVNTFMGKGIIPWDSKYSLWSVGLSHRDYINRVFEQTDLVIAVGYDIIEYTPRQWNLNRNIKIIHVGQEMAEVNKYYEPYVEVIGDISDSIYEIVRRSDRGDEPLYSFIIKEEMQKDYEDLSKDTTFPMKPQKILYDVRKFMGSDDIIISDVGAHKMWIARHYHCYKPNTCIMSNGFAAMGIAIPGALAAKLINPDKKVLAITGDGGFMMNSQELETARRLNVPFVSLIFNDSGYGLIKWKQEERYGKSAYVEFTNPDFKAMAESMGLKGYRVEKSDGLLEILTEAFKQSVPCVIDCKVDYSENLRLTQKFK